MKIYIKCFNSFSRSGASLSLLIPANLYQDTTTYPKIYTTLEQTGDLELSE